MSNFEKELKKEFQLERMILFSDAVFAIAITLLVIEIKVPHIEGPVNDAAIAGSLAHLIPVFFGFIISFAIIGVYWTVHHRIFGYLINYDNKLIWLNLFFLFSIVIMPFTSGLYGELYQPNVMLPFIIYSANICLTGVVNVLLIKHICDPRKNLSQGFNDKNAIKLAYARSWMMPVIFTLGVIISFLTLPWIGRMAPMLMPLYNWIVTRKYTKKSKTQPHTLELANS